MLAFNSLNIVSIAVLNQCLIIPLSGDLLLLPVLCADSTHNVLSSHVSGPLYVLDTVFEKLFIWNGRHVYSGSLLFLECTPYIFFCPKTGVYQCPQCWQTWHSIFYALCPTRVYMRVCKRNSASWLSFSDWHKNV